MVKFPVGQVYRKRRSGVFRSSLITLLLLTMFIAAWFYSQLTDQREDVAFLGQKLYVVDGDSFTAGPRKFRLDGIDAPELKQNCSDATGAEWPCGRTARAALEKMLLLPGLSCVAEMQDRYGRSLATCRTALISDIAASQVRDGMAVTHEFNGMRDYGREEDAARNAKRGIWSGSFERPEDWRASHLQASEIPS